MTKTDYQNRMQAMKPHKIAILSILVFLATTAFAADLDYPYGRFRIKLPPSEDPLPGLGSYYSTLSEGMKSALWNPASLGKLKLAEASLSMIAPLERYNYERSFDIEEPGGDLEFGGTTEAGGRYGIFFRYPQDIGPGLATKEIEVMSHSNYATETTGLNFSTALNVNEWLSVGFASYNPMEVDMDIAGDFPVSAKALSDFHGQTFGDMVIEDDGKLKYTYTDGSITATYESTAEVWSGFLSQEATIPLLAFSELRNNLHIQAPYVGTIASKFGNLCVGMNMIPISASLNIDNDVRAVVSADTQNVNLYHPNFNPENETDIQDWVNNPNRYGSSDGYSRKELILPAGEVVGTAKYRGFYSASTARLDLGAMYDVTDWLTVGIVLENINSSSLKFRGNGIATFYNYRDLNTEEAENMDDLLKPGEGGSIDLVSDRWITSFEVNGTKLYLEPEKTYELPKRIRYGIALKRPFLIAIDLEQNMNEIKIFATEGDEVKEYTISNIQLLRIGTETQFFTLPFWMRSGLTLLAKPTVTGLDADAQKSFDDAFQFGYLPLKFDLGANINAWGTIIGGALGFNGQSVFNLVQFDVTNSDLTKMIFYDIYVGKDAWRVNYLAQADPLASAAAYGSKTVPAGEEKKFEYGDVKIVQTLGVTYRF